MEFKVTMTTEEIREHSNPHKALEILKERLVNQILATYIVTATDQGDSVVYTAKLRE